jgi:23S rRNA (pseudouridine1915-N3)-methyltransferase
MKLVVLAVGQRQPAWVDAACADLLKRFPPDFAVTLRQLKAEPREGRSVERLMAAEAQRLRDAEPAGALRIALDERGKALTSSEFAGQLGRWRDAAEQPVFAVGGADGLEPGYKQEARFALRLSSMTLPHALARIVLLEQLYRGWSILVNHPYHRA